MLTIENGYIILDKEVDPNNKKKITGHSFVQLAGLDEYAKPGDAVLSLLKYYKADVDKKYLYRGELAEKMIGFMLTKNNKQFVYHDEEDKKRNNYDFFPNYKFCGGIPDFEIPSEKTIHEVKSKSMEKLEDIMSKLPKGELWQGLFYTYLKRWNYLVMDYVFFDSETEKYVFNNQRPKTLDKCQVRFFPYQIVWGEEEIKPKLNYVYAKDIKEKIIEAICYYDKCLTEKRIPLEDVSPQVLRKIGLTNEDGL